mgnify:FL=1
MGWIHVKECAMTNEDVQDPLNEVGVHFCLVSKQAAVNLLPVEHYRPNAVVLFVSHEMKAQARDLQAAMLKTLPGLRINIISLADAWDLAGVRDAVWSQLEELCCDVNQIAVNVTGGTKIMMLGALLAASAAGARCFYINESDNSISLIDPDSNDGSRRMQKVRLQTKVETYLKAYGFQVEDSSRMPSVSMSEKKLIESLINTPSFRDVMPLLNMLSADRETEKALKVSFKGRIPPQNRAAFDALCDRFIQTGHLNIRGDIMSFPSEADRFFVAGGWLERYVFNTLSDMKMKPEGNITVIGDAKNEIDVAFFHEGSLCIVECKTGNLSASEDANQVIYKLESLKKLGGIKTKLILVSYKPISAKSNIRATGDKTHILLIQGDQLKRLKDNLTRCLQK